MAGADGYSFGPDEIGPYVEAFSRPRALTSAINYYRAAFRQLATGRTPRVSVIPCPTLVVIGEEDHTTPLADAQLMASHIPDARLAVIPAAGHLSNCEQPEMFNDLLRGFVEGLRSNEGKPSLRL